MLFYYLFSQETEDPPVYLWIHHEKYHEKNVQFINKKKNEGLFGVIKKNHSVIGNRDGRRMRTKKINKKG